MIEEKFNNKLLYNFFNSDNTYIQKIQEIHRNLIKESCLPSDTAYKIISQAAAKTIHKESDLQPKAIKNIETSCNKIKQKICQQVEAKEKKLANKTNLLNNMTDHLSDQNIDLSDPQAVEKMWEDYYHITAGIVSYKNWKPGNTIPGPHKDLPNYKVSKRIKNAEGLQIVVLVPQQKGAPPILCCRGLSNLGNFVDGMQNSIGQKGFEASKAEILKTLDLFGN